MTFYTMSLYKDKLIFYKLLIMLGVIVQGTYGRVFANGPGDLGSFPVRFIPKYLMRPCLTLSIIRYGSRVKWRNPGKGVAPSPTPWCCSYRKGSLWVNLDYGRQLYFYLCSSTEKVGNDSLK